MSEYTYTEYLAPGQTNVLYGETFDITNKAPLIAKRIWGTLADAQGWIDDYKGKAVAGLVITVINDNTPENNGVYLVQTKDPSVTPSLADNNLKLVKLSNSSDVNATIGEMNVPEYPQANINTTFGVNTTILTIESILQRNGVIGAGDLYKTDIAIDGVYNALTNKIATQDTVRELNTTIGDIINTVIGEVNTTIGELTADDISANYNTTAGRIQNTVQGAIDYMTERIQDLESLPTYETIVCSTAQNTPSGITWKNEQGETITGQLPAGENTKHKIYLVPQKTVSGGDNFDEYITIDKGNDQYDWEKIGSTAGVFEGIEEVADGLVKDATVNTQLGHYIIQNNTALSDYGKLLPAQDHWTEGADTYQKSDHDGLTMASDVKAYVDTVSSLTMNIAANGVNIGNIVSGQTVFTVGESISYILKQILTKTIAINTTYPTVALNIPSIPSTSTEIGTTVPELTLSTKITGYGSYTSADPDVFTLTEGWDYSTTPKQKVTTGTGTLNAVCGYVTNAQYNEPSITGLTDDTVTLTNNKISSFQITKEGSCTISVVNNTCKLSSNIHPINNIGEEDVNIENYYPTIASTTFYGRFKFFYGCCAYDGRTTQDKYDNVILSMDDLLDNNNTRFAKCSGRTTKQAWCIVETKNIGTKENPENVTAVHIPATNSCPLDKMKGVTGKTSLMLVIPSVYSRIMHAANWLGGTVDWEPVKVDDGEGNFVDKILQYNKNGVVTDYKMYYISTDADLEYQKIYFNK